MNPLDNASVQRVRAALAAAGSGAVVVALAATARSAEEAARALGIDVGAIVKSLVFLVDDRPVVALVSGDRRCREAALPSALGLSGRVRRADAAAVRAATGFAIGGVAPVGFPAPLPVAIDAGLSRFDAVFAAAGHPYCVFRTTVTELQHLTGGVIAADLAVETGA
ncbi:MAG: YbaK/EbsC family protein [Rhodospirillales bacterium]|nr:MAG: YbaK/EbsC family protein [Rhodospirillales bacterium]